MRNRYKTKIISGKFFLCNRFKKTLPFLFFSAFLFCSLAVTSCNQITSDFDKNDEISSDGKPFFSLTVRASNDRNASENLRATTYTPVVTWNSEQGFRNAVTDFVITVGNEAPQNVTLGSSVASRGTYREGSNVTVSYTAYGNVMFTGDDGSSETKREIIASETNSITVSAGGTVVNFKVSAGLKTPDAYTEESKSGTVKYVAGADDVQNIPSDSSNYEIGAEVTLSATEPARLSYIFAGWTSNVALTAKSADGGEKQISPNTPFVSVGSSSSVNEQITSFKMPSGGVVLTANWTPNTSTPFDVTINATALKPDAKPNIINVREGDNITVQVTEYLQTISNEQEKYELNSGVSFTAQQGNPTIVLDASNVTTKVQMQLAETILDSQGKQIIGADVDIRVSFTDSGEEDAAGLMWYEVGKQLPTDVTISGTDANKYRITSGWQIINDNTSLTVVTKEMAGATLYPKSEEAMFTITVIHFRIEGGDQYIEIPSSELSAKGITATDNITIPNSVPYGTIIDSVSEDDTNLISIASKDYEFTISSGTSAGCYISTTNDNGTLDIGMGDQDDIAKYEVTQDIFLGIYWEWND